MQMIDIDKWNAECESKPFGKGCTYVKRPRQPRASRESNGADLRLGNSGLTNSLGDDRHNVLLMSPRCELRDYAAVGFVNLLA